MQYSCKEFFDMNDEHQGHMRSRLHAAVCDDCNMILRGDSCMQTHPQAFIHICRRRFYISSQLIETYRRARVFSLLVGDIDATGQALMGAMYLKIQRMQPRMQACGAYLLPTCWQKDTQNLGYIFT